MKAIILAGGEGLRCRLLTITRDCVIITTGCSVESGVTVSRDIPQGSTVL